MAIRYLSGINVDSNTLFVDSTNNRVGIGTGSPSQLLHLNAASGAVYTRVQNNINSLYLGLESGGIAQVSSDVSSLKVMANTFTSFETSGSERMRITSAGNVGIGTTSPLAKLQVSGGRAYFFSGDNYSVGLAQTAAQGNYMYLGTASDGTFYISETSGTARVTVQQGGNVGIGTTSPATALDVVGTVTAYRYQAISSSASLVGYGVGTGLGMFNAGTDTLGFATASSERMRITSAGNVGIGTYSPSTKLHTVGNIRSANAGNTVYSELQNDGVYAVGTDLYLLAPASKFVSIYAGNAERMRIASTGATRLNAYGSGSITGTATYGLAVDASGNVIEVTSTLDGSGTTNYVTKWADSNTLTDSQIFDNGTNVGIGTAAPSVPLEISHATGNGLKIATNDATTNNNAGIVIENVASSTSTTRRSVFIMDPTSGTGTGGDYFYITSYGNGLTSLTNAKPDGILVFGTADTERLRITAGGNVLIGTTTDVGHLLYVNGTSRFNGVIHGASRLMVGITSDQTYASIFVGGDITTGGSQYALLLDPQLSGTNNYGLFANARIKASHAATNAYGVYIVNNELLSGASVVNNYGLYIANQTNGSSVNYALYSAGGTSYFAGNVGIGTGSPNAPLHIVKDLGTSVSAVLRLRGSNSTARTTRLQFEDYNGTIADGLIDFIVPTAGSSTGARLDIGVDSAIVSVVKGGNVGIGTTSPSALLHVSQASANTIFRLGNNTTYDQFIYFNGNNDWSLGMDYSNSNAFVLSNASSIGTNDRVVVTTGGNVGIGTTSPVSLLNLASTFPQLTFTRTDNGTSPAAAINFASTSTIRWQIATNNAVGPGFEINQADGSTNRFYINTSGNVGIGTTSPAYKLTVDGDSSEGSIGIERTTVSANTVIGALNFTNNNGGTVYGRVRGGRNAAGDGYVSLGTGLGDNLYAIEGGNVGIGTASPTARLSLGAASQGYRVTWDNYSNVFSEYSSGDLWLSSNFYGNLGSSGFVTSSTASFGAAGIAVSGTGGGLNGVIKFFVDNAASKTAGDPFTPSERMRITGGGNVLIGTTTDAGIKLDVNGTGRFSGGVLYLGNYSGNPELTLQASSNSWSKINFYDHNNTEGLYIRTDGASYGGTMTLGARWDDDEGKVFFKMFQSSAGAAYDVKIGVNTGSPESMLHLDKSSSSNNISDTPSIIISNKDSTSGTFIGGGIFNNAYRDVSSSSITAGIWFENQNSTGAGALAKQSAVIFGAQSYATGYNTPSERMRITADGNVGIGTTAPSQLLHVSGNIRVTGAYYDSNNEAGTSGQVLSSTGSGTDWITPATTTATSLYDLLPAARVAFNWTGQVVNDTWTTVFSKSSNLLTTGTWMVKMYVSDFATGGGHYTYTYSGMFTWYQDTTNQGGEQAASEIYLHRMGHAANASVLYLRTTETAAASSGDGLFQIKGNYSNTSNQTIQFQFVKIF